MTTLGGTEQDALDRRATLDDLAGTDDGVALLAYRLGVSPDMLELDKPVPEVLLGGLGNVTGHARPAAALAGQGLTVRDILHRGGGSGHVQAIGTPDQVASQIEAWHASTAVDGFTVMPDVTVDGLPDFVDHVVPILQRRGLFRTEYRGETLRDHYGLPVPDVAMRRGRQAARA
jgi:alkanesulfonate monooxygenase SsuD/methylene tetrahydromethanopterin reductase-like flavin-dependent oxidoreductase (luciferase family)